jgi:hypothetical protein
MPSPADYKRVPGSAKRYRSRTIGEEITYRQYLNLGAQERGYSSFNEQSRAAATFTSENPIRMIARDISEPFYVSVPARQRRVIAQYQNAVKKYVNSGDTSALRRFEGRYVTVDGQRYYFETDRTELDWHARLGNLSGFEDIYKR